MSLKRPSHLSPASALFLATHVWGLLETGSRGGKEIRSTPFHLFPPFSSDGTFGEIWRGQEESRIRSGKFILTKFVHSLPECDGRRHRISRMTDLRFLNENINAISLDISGESQLKITFIFLSAWLKISSLLICKILNCSSFKTLWLCKFCKFVALLKLNRNLFETSIYFFSTLIFLSHH